MNSCRPTVAMEPWVREPSAFTQSLSVGVTSLVMPLEFWSEMGG